MADDGIIPLPSLGIDGLADSAEDSDCAEVVAFDVVSAETAEEPDSGGSRVELVSPCVWTVCQYREGVGVDWGRFKDGGGDAV
jgi:hypothetical protein